jgi:hypothetical protein
MPASRFYAGRNIVERVHRTAYSKLWAFQCVYFTRTEIFTSCWYWLTSQSLHILTLKMSMSFFIILGLAGSWGEGISNSWLRINRLIWMSLTKWCEYLCLSYIQLYQSNWTKPKQTPSLEHVRQMQICFSSDSLGTICLQSHRFRH